ncbi:Gfo/Idh/MocA family protein [Rhodovibrionaceae bacterium A322]
MSDTLKLVVAGAGLVGQRHIRAIATQQGVELAAIVDPQPPEDTAVPCYPDLEHMFAEFRPDGVVLSTPTLLHADGGLQCLEHRCPVLIEKPLAASVIEAQKLVVKSELLDVPVLVGHHRRHNPLIQKAKDLLVAGEIGTIRGFQATCWFYKPDDYFEVAPWRKEKGAGPISVNLVHDVDLMRHFCGEVSAVQAQMTPSRRGYENEDLAAAVLSFETGAIATLTVSDSVVAPWSWELTSGEHPIYPQTAQSCYLIGGSRGSLSVPDLTLWNHHGKQSWWEPISGTSVPRERSDPLLNQISHFAEVIRGRASPLVSAEEGLRTMLVIEAIQLAAASGTRVQIDELLQGLEPAAQ